MKTFVQSMAGTLVAMFLFIPLCLMLLVFFTGVASLGDLFQKDPDVVLTVDLREPLADQAPASGFAAFSGQQGFTDLILKIDGAIDDDHVKGIFIRGADSSIGSARAEELRDVLVDFRDSGKFVIAHTQGGLASFGPSSYRAISAADELWMQPGPDPVATGIVFETEFLKGLFDKLSITPEIIALYEFKNAPNSYNNETYTEPHRLALTELADSVWSVSLHDIAEDRGLQYDALKNLLESGPIPAEQAEAESLVDTLGWPEDAMDAAKERAGGNNVSFVSLGEYTAPAVKSGAPMIAVIGGEGPIITGSAGGDLFSDSVGFGSDRVARGILNAADNDDVRAIVFRVDSPGGSPTASDQIWNAINRAQDAGKPVVVSMGSVAASGGYYVSAGADRILANDTTITGSIGIFGGKIAIADGLERIGINIEPVLVGGEWSTAFSADRFTNAQRDQMVEMLERGYNRFTSIVAEGRGLTQEEVHERARGRVWSGEDAIGQGLVDEIGGFRDAIDAAKELAGIDAERDVQLIWYPQRRSGFDALEDAFGVSVEAGDTLSTLHEFASDPQVRALLEELQAARAGGIQARGPTLIER